MTYHVSIPTYSFGRSNVAVRAYPIQSNPIQSNPIQSNPIQSYPIQSNTYERTNEREIDLIR